MIVDYIEFMSFCYLKGLKQTAITGKIPATKRSLERFLFRVKALLHTTSSGCTFWMGMPYLGFTDIFAVLFDERKRGIYSFSHNENVLNFLL